MDLYDSIMVAMLVVGGGILFWCAMKSGTGSGAGKPPAPNMRTEMDDLRFRLAAAEGSYQRTLSLLTLDTHNSPADVIICFLAIFGIEEKVKDIPEEVLSTVNNPQLFKAALEKHYDLVIETTWRNR